MTLPLRPRTLDPGANAAEATFRILFERSFAPVTAYVRRRLTGPDGVDDVVAEVFMVAWRRWEERPESHDEVLPWIYGIAGNVLRNHHRSTRRRRALVGRLQSTRPPARTGEVDLEVMRVRDALARLAPGDQEVLRLIAWEDLSHREASVALGCSANAVAIRLHRARARLIDELGSASHERSGAQEDMESDEDPHRPTATPSEDLS